MAHVTDPAKELFEIVTALSGHSSGRGDEFLATQFGVEAYSTEFFKVIGAILARADTVANLVPQLELDEEIEQNAIHDLTGFKSAFSGGPLRNKWSDGGRVIVADHGKGLQYLQLRRIESYPKLDQKEADELLVSITNYRATFSAFGMPAFIAQAIRDGLDQAIFHLTFLKWTGAAYQLRAFRELEAARLSLEHWQHGVGESVFRPELVIQGLRAITESFFASVNKVKEHSDTLGWIALGYNVGAPALGLPSLPQLPQIGGLSG